MGKSKGLEMGKEIKEGTDRPRAIRGQRYPLPCLAWLKIGMRGRAAAPKGTKSCRTQGTFVCSFVCPSVRPSVLESARADFRPERADSRPERIGFRSERANFRPKRADLRPARADFRPEKSDFRPERADFRPKRAGGRT